MIRSSNVSDFLGKNSVPALVQEALAKSKVDDRELNIEEERIATEKNRAEEEKLSALAKSTGLSIETLRMIKKVEDKVIEKKKETQLVMNEQVHKQRQQTLINLASQIRYIMQMRRTGTLQMNILLEQLSDKQAGEFIDRQERLRLIEELASLVPQWLQVKQMPSFGKIVKCNNTTVN